MNSIPTSNSSLVNLKSIVIASSLALGVVALPAQAALTFSFNYLNPGQGFQDATYGADRQAALNNAANRFGAYFTNYTANLTFDVTSYSTNDTTLASAGSGSYLFDRTFQQTFVQEKILTGIDRNGADADGSISWNFFHNWDITDPVAPDAMDFTSTAMHELMHAFGFSSYVDENGRGLGYENYGINTWSIYDQFLIDSAGNRLIDTDGVFVGDPGALTDSVRFNGANAMAANGDNAVALFAPDTWMEGSSISHPDDSSLLMAYASGEGPGVRTLSDIEIGMLKDIGYANLTTPVPLPAAVWLMGSGLMAMFGFTRRRKIA